MAVASDERPRGNDSPGGVMDRIDVLIQACLLIVRQRSWDLVAPVIILVCHCVLVLWFRNAEARRGVGA